MISALTGVLQRVEEDRIHVRVGPITVEALVPAADIQPLAAGVGEPVELHTLFYIEGDASGGNLEPRLIAFLRAEDKQFFQKFITVKGIGPKKALKALVHPAAEVAQAIESKDTRFLKGLPTIGNRMAEQIVAELSGKVAAFARMTVQGRPAGPAAPPSRSAIEEEAIKVLITLGERRAEAEGLLERVKQANGDLKTSNELAREMLRLRMVRA